MVRIGQNNFSFYRKLSKVTLFSYGEGLGSNYKIFGAQISFNKLKFKFRSIQMIVSIDTGATKKHYLNVFI